MLYFTFFFSKKALSPLGVKIVSLLLCESPESHPATAPSPRQQAFTGARAESESSTLLLRTGALWQDSEEGAPPKPPSMQGEGGSPVPGKRFIPAEECVRFDVNQDPTTRGGSVYQLPSWRLIPPPPSGAPLLSKQLGFL